MVVGRSSFAEVLEKLGGEPELSLDTETTGLRPHRGDRLFSIIIGAPDQSYYFNFQPYPGLDPEWVLLPEHLKQLAILGRSLPSRVWYLHRAKFDLAMLENEGISLAGSIHCTQVIARVEHNAHMTYSLADCAERIGFKKDETVEKCIDDQGFWDWVEIPGKKQRAKNKYYYKVPFDIIVPYGETDAHITYRLGQHQKEALQRIEDETPRAVPSVQNVAANERRLVRTVVRMERVGLRIDRPYCVRAASYEAARAQGAMDEFKKLTGRAFSASGKLFADVFANERDKWDFTDKGNPSFESDILKRFENPAARCILEYRDAKSKSDFYQGFLYHADEDDVIHPNLNQDGATTGRFSSSEPNFQNLTSEEGEEEQEFTVRRAIIPRPGYVLIMPDYDQMEYRMMFDYACQILGRESEIVKKIKQGLDPHQATADAVTSMGTPLSRSRAKNGNFAILYGSGNATLAWTIKSSLAEAKSLRESIFRAAPEMRTLVRDVMDAATRRGFIFNWAGRRAYFPDSQWAYKAPNYLIQGGCADVSKFAMNRIDDYLADKKSRMILTVHDEFPIEVHESEIDTVPRRVKEIMESVYPYKYLPLTAGMEWSDKSMADKQKGFPTQSIIRGSEDGKARTEVEAVSQPHHQARG